MKIVPLHIVSFIACALLIPCSAISAPDATPARPPVLHPYLRMAESDPVKIGSLEFIAAVQDEWPLDPRNFHPGESVDVQLIIINHGDKDVLFPTFDTFQIGLKHMDGTEIPMRGVRTATFFTKPLLIPAGGRVCLCRDAKIIWDDKIRAPIFLYRDGTGTSTTCPLTPGDYALRFVLNSTPFYLLPDEIKKQASGITSDGVVIPLWKGKGETKEVKFRVIEVKE
jgi:hypothetical protein